MGALPKRKISKRRRDNRRAHHALSLSGLSKCPKCSKMKKSHTVCPYCGTYKGKEVK